MPDFDSKHLTGALTALRSETERVGLADASDVRRRGDHRTRVAASVVALTASLCLVAAAIGFGSLGGGKERATELPASKPVTEDTLLIRDELPLSQMKMDDSGQGEPATPVTSCQQGSLASLAPKTLWHRSFNSDYVPEDDDLGMPEGDGLVRQVIATFEGDQQAAAAIQAFERWFDQCDGVTKRGVQHYKTISEAGGRVHGLNFSKPHASAEHSGSVMVEYVGYGIVGAAVTIVSYTADGQDSWFTDQEFIELNPSFAENPMIGTLRFAMQRLSGKRTLSTNAVPDTFQFAEEKTSTSWQPPDSSVEHAHGGSRSLNMTELWQFSPCWLGILEGEALASDALRIGMVTARNEDGDYPTNVRQVALYHDEATATAVAEELRSAFADCPSVAAFDGKATITWTTAREVGSYNLMIGWSTTTSKNSRLTRFSQSIAIAQLGKAIFLATEKGDEAGPDSPAVRAARNSVGANAQAICNIADCQ